MTAAEIFKNIKAHQIEGVMFHKNMMRAYEFLGLPFMVTWHKYQVYSEFEESNKTEFYLIDHLNTILVDEHYTSPFNIPASWEGVNRLELTNNNRRQYFKEMMDRWHEWEQSTKAMYQNCYMQLLDLKEVAAAIQVKHLIKDVDKELACLQKKYIAFAQADWNLRNISELADDIQEEYEDKLEEMKLC